MSRKKSIKTQPKGGAIYRQEKAEEREAARKVARKSRRKERLIPIPGEMPPTLFAKRGDVPDEETIRRYWRNRRSVKKWG